MGLVPPPMPVIPEQATWEQRIYIYEMYVNELIAGLWPWQRKAARKKLKERIEEARRTGPPTTEERKDR